MRSHLLEQSLGDDTRALAVRVRQEHHELLAAHARHQIAGASRAADHVREVAQHGVPGEMPVRVVHSLEVIDVDREERYLTAIP
jgi:hypothetical protein